MSVTISSSDAGWIFRRVGRSSKTTRGAPPVAALEPCKEQKSRPLGILHMTEVVHLD
jgi:hypothetical protein